jgi:hypothetical protein
MPGVTITRETFLAEIQGRTFSDVLNDPEQPFDEVLQFFNDEDRQRRMEESEIHHDRSPLAGVVRELESHPAINQFLSDVHTQRSNRLRQAIGVVVRMVMQQRGWRKTGRKGSLGVRAAKTSAPSARHNCGGLAFWFIRGERYECEDGMPYRSVRERCEELDAIHPQDSSAEVKRNVHTKGRRTGASSRSIKKKSMPGKTKQADQKKSDS